MSGIIDVNADVEYFRISPVFITAKLAGERNKDVQKPERLSSSPRLSNQLPLVCQCWHTSLPLYSILMFRVFWAYLWWRGHSYLPVATAAYRGYGLTGNTCITAAGRIKGRWYTGNRCASPEPLTH